MAGLCGLYCLNSICPRYEYKVSSICSKGEGCLIFAFLMFISSNSSVIHANSSVFQRSFIVSLSSKVIRRWRWILNDEDGLFKDLAAPRRPGLFLYTFSARISWICSSLLVFHSDFNFFLQSVYSKLHSACDGALLSFRTSSRVLSFYFCWVVSEFLHSFDVFSFIIFSILTSSSSSIYSISCSTFVTSPPFSASLLLLSLSSS